MMLKRQQIPSIIGKGFMKSVLTQHVHGRQATQVSVKAMALMMIVRHRNATAAC